MSSPLLRNAHIDHALANVVIGNFAEQPSLLRRVFAVAPVEKQSGRYFIWDRGDLMRTAAQRRAPGQKPAERTLNLSSTTYSCDEWAVRQPLYEETEKGADLELRKPIAKALAQDIMTRESLIFVSTYMATSVWSADVTPGTTANYGVIWSDSAATPINDIRRATRTIRTDTGYRPNVFVCNDAVADALVEHPDVKGRIPITQSSMIGVGDREKFLSSILGLEVVIADQSYNSANENQTDSFSAVLSSNHALLAYKTPNPSINEPSAGYVFSWKAFDGGGTARVYTDGDPGVKTNWLEANSYVDAAVTASSCGILFTNVL